MRGEFGGAFKTHQWAIISGCAKILFNLSLTYLPMPSISVIIITRNEERFIRNCLASVAWADEIIVVDSGSTDNTLAICQEFTPHIISTQDWPGYGAQKNRALNLATREWVLALDADEWVTAELHQEILAALANPAYASIDAFSLPRRNQYLGRWLYYGDVGRDRVTRLFRRGSAVFSNAIVHEAIQVPSQKIADLQQPLLHNTYRTVEELLERMNRYSSLSAAMRYEKGQKGGIMTGVLHGFWAFFKAYILRQGFRDGRIGFIAAVYASQSSFYRYVKLWFLDNK